MVHRDDGVVRAGEMLVEDRVGGDRAGDVPAAAAAAGEGRRDDRPLFVAEGAAVAGVGIEPAHADARAPETHPRQGAGEQLDGFDDGVGRQRVRDFPQGQVARGEHDADPVAEEHHGVAPGAGQAREQLGVAGLADAGFHERFLADRGGDEGGEAAVQRRGRGGQDVGVGGAGGVGADLAGALGRRRRHVRIPRAPAGQRRGQVGHFGRQLPPDQPGGAFPDFAVADQDEAAVRRLRPQRGAQRHFRADPVGVARGQADGEGFHGRAQSNSAWSKVCT